MIKSNRLEAIIYPGFISNYYVFYILGLTRLFPEIKLKFSNNSYPLRLISYLAFQINDLKVLIDATDYPGVDKPALDWCDICGKVNLPNTNIDIIGDKKVVPIGPSFGIRFWPIFKAFPLGLRNFTCAKLNKKYLRMFMGGYLQQSLFRLQEDEYFPGQVEDDYIFSVNSYWSKEDGSKEANEFRKRFIECIKNQKEIKFEGGFYKRSQIEDPVFRNLQVDNPYKISDYLDKVKRSFVVFNTPAVKGCLGWKLGEFLALGKAIITTPINQKMPSNLEDRKHVHIVDGSLSSIESAIQTIRKNPDYRNYLEKNARNYYLDHLRPEKVISSLLKPDLYNK